MNRSEYDQIASATLERLESDASVGEFVDATLKPPQPFGLEAGARLVIIGQDPTVKRAASRGRIRVVLNLDQKGALRSYLNDICGLLGLDLDREVAAINAANNFFIQPPTQLPNRVLRVACQVWAPVVRRQLNAHPEACVLSLGQPVVEALAQAGASGRVRDYWGFVNSSRAGDPGCFGALLAVRNLLATDIYPFPHQPSRHKPFYARTFPSYARFVSSRCRLPA